VIRKEGAEMAASATTLTEKMRAALRISSTSEKITEEIEDCIAACKADLKNDGIKVLDETDELVVRAVTLYCKAEFGYNDKAEKFRESYDTLKMRLAMSKEYNTEQEKPEVSETDTETAESEA
jgi:hypothetical protein